MKLDRAETIFLHVTAKIKVAEAAGTTADIFLNDAWHAMVLESEAPAVLYIRNERFTAKLRTWQLLVRGPAADTSSALLLSEGTHAGVRARVNTPDEQIVRYIGDIEVC